MTKSVISTLNQVMSVKYDEPITRQEYFGAITPEEYQALVSSNTANTATFQEDPAHACIQLLSQPRPIVRLHPEFSGVDKTHMAVAVMKTRTYVSCPVTGRKATQSWTYYLTEKMLKEIRDLL